MGNRERERDGEERQWERDPQSCLQTVELRSVSGIIQSVSLKV